MLGVVALALLGALLAHASANLREFSTVVGVPGHEPGVQRRHVGDVPTEPEALGHILSFAGARVGAPLTSLGGFETVLQAISLLVV